MNWDTSAELELTRIFEGATEKCLSKLVSFINYYYYCYYYYYYNYYYYVALICEASKELELVVTGVGKSIHWKNLYPVDSTVHVQCTVYFVKTIIHWIRIYLLDSVISSVNNWFLAIMRALKNTLKDEYAKQGKKQWSWNLQFFISTYVPDQLSLICWISDLFKKKIIQGTKSRWQEVRVTPWGSEPT